MTACDTPRIYVADLAAYNAGYLHGVWIDATQDLENIWAAIRAMLATSPVPDAEEFAIHDYEHFYDVKLHEYSSLKTAHRLACFIAEHGELGAELLRHWSNDLNQASTSIEENYCGCYDSLADYAQQFTEETTSIPKALEYYIDYGRMARDWEMSGDIFAIKLSGKVHAFYNH